MAYAAEDGYIDIVRLMLQRGANDYNKTILNAAEGGYTYIVELMLKPY